MTPEAALSFRVPGSKSQTQRGLILAALAPGESRLSDPLDCADSRVLRRALVALGVQIREEGRDWVIDGGQLRCPTEKLWCGDAGTTMRFLAPLSLLMKGELILDGSDRLRARPMTELSEALGRLGVQVRHLGRGSLPLALCGPARPVRGTWIDGRRSSQFVSGLLMVAPCLEKGLELELGNGTVSAPYVEMTLRAMGAFGASAQDVRGSLKVLPQRYHPGRFDVEGDWSSAAFLLCGARLVGREIKLENLAPRSVQGDRAIVAFLEELERKQPHRFDLTPCPDLLPPLAAAAVVAGHPVEITGVAHARVKESDRVAVLAEGLARAGVRVEELPDGLRIVPGGGLRPARLDPHGDHRMAMAFGLLSLLEPRLEVSDPGCVDKSYPSFWDDLRGLR